MPEYLDRNGKDIFCLNAMRDGVFHVEQMPCWITHTNTHTHDIILANLHKSPMYSGKSKESALGIAPRLRIKW